MLRSLLLLGVLLGPAVAGTAEQAPAGPHADALLLWLKADAVAPADATQVRVEGANSYLVRWPSLAPGAQAADPVQADAKRQPRFVTDGLNGHPVVRFERAQVHGLTHPTASLVQPGAPRTVVVVGQAKRQAGTGGTLFTFGRTTAAGARVATLQQWEGGPHYVYSDGVTVNITIPSAGATIAEPFLAVYRLTGPGQALSIELNGQPQTASGGLVAAETGAAGFTVGNREDEGARNAQGWEGDIAEVLVYGRQLSDGELETTAAYLTEKYRLKTEYQAYNLPPLAARTVDFRRDVHPILASHCFECHQGQDAAAGHRLDQRDELLGLNNGIPLVEVGNSRKSRLVHLAARIAPDKKMPPEGEGEPLTAEQVGILRAWIDQGLKWDDGLLPPFAAQTTHWAFQPVADVPVPAVKNPAWVRTPVDAFVAAEHEKRNLHPAAEAARRDLIRRLSLDLLGLPPGPDEVDAFLADPAPNAYERLVERLLASPHYGERWGRHWLDVARWADTDGYETNALRPFAWRYRDYVVQSFNADKPYDRFLREQIAGDELEPYADENLIATGYLAAARYSSNEDDTKRQASDVLIDIVNATSSGLLGLTMGCAQCHNHKFDPITQRDYYRFQGFFTKGRQLNLLLKDPELWKAYEALKDPKAPKPQTVGFFSPLSPHPVEAFPLEAVFPLAYNAAELKASESRILVRGEYTRPGPIVGAGWPAIFGPPPSSESFQQRPRSALVDWLVDRRNPLTARVWVNRIWHYHFGRGLVDPPSDFGVRSERPSHPELLDWLAGELMRSGWSTKHVQRLILRSSVYRQASKYDAANAALDAQNRLLWRWQPRRIEAEVIRDSVLVTSGQLDTKFGGPSIARDAEGTALRRSIYLRQDRNDFPETQVFFDGPATTESCAMRATSTVPLQPLYLLNNSFMIARAKAFAGRVKQAAGDDTGKQVDAAFRIALSRLPEASERAAALGFLTAASDPAAAPAAGAPSQTKLEQFCHTLMNVNEFFYVE